MTGYEWVTERSFGQYPPTGGGALWNTPSGVPKAAVRVPSPVGEGDVLIRVRVSAFIGIYGADSSWYPFKAVSQLWQLKGEVGSSSSTPPDPTLDGEGGIEFSADMEPALTLNDTGSPTSPAPWSLRATTGGYVESKGKRGVAEYGGVHPYFVLGLVQVNDAYLDPTAHSIQSFWGFTARCLWFTP
jgi:hypothetical protein